jgi:hypothetical protein
MVSSGMLRRVALVRTDVPEEPSASFIRVTRIGELGTATSFWVVLDPTAPGSTSIRANLPMLTGTLGLCEVHKTSA